MPSIEDIIMEVIKRINKELVLNCIQVYHIIVAQSMATFDTIMNLYVGNK